MLNELVEVIRELLICVVATVVLIAIIAIVLTIFASIVMFIAWCFDLAVSPKNIVGIGACLLIIFGILHHCEVI